MTDRLLREVTRDEWIELPIERCYAYREIDSETGLNGKVRYFEIVKKEES